MKRENPEFYMQNLKKMACRNGQSGTGRTLEEESVSYSHGRRLMPGYARPIIAKTHQIKNGGLIW